MLADRYDLIVFDLDGTLTDSLPDIAVSVNHALVRLGLPPIDIRRVREHVGEGVRRLIARSLDPRGAIDAPEDTRLFGLALDLFLRHYRAHAVCWTRPYPGVVDVLDALSGRPLAVLTNKPIEMTRRILAELSLASRFTEILGGDSLPERKPSPVGLVHLARSHGVAPRRTLMVGDSGIDMRTARAAGAGAAGVTWGYRPEEVRAAEPDHILDSIEDLLRPGEAAKNG